MGPPRAFVITLARHLALVNMAPALRRGLLVAPLPCREPPQECFQAAHQAVFVEVPQGNLDLPSANIDKDIAGGRGFRQRGRHRQLAQVLEELQAGDRLVVSELSRLGRSMLECMEILALMAQKGIQLYAVKGDWQLDGTMQSTIMAMVFAMAAEIERELISQRTKK